MFLLAELLAPVRDTPFLPGRGLVRVTPELLSLAATEVRLPELATVST